VCLDGVRRGVCILLGVCLVKGLYICFDGVCVFHFCALLLLGVCFFGGVLNMCFRSTCAFFRCSSVENTRVTHDHIFWRVSEHQQNTQVPLVYFFGVHGIPLLFG